jgi:phage terminase large subunit-like protein
MQSPISRETQEFKEHMFRYFDEGDLNGKYLRYYTLVDPAISQNKKADNSVVLTVAKEVNGPNIYRVREDAGHYTPQELIDLIFVHQNEYGSRVFVEAVQYQQAIKYAILEQQRKLQKYFLINEIKAKTTMSKESRIRGLLPLYATGVIFHRRTDTEYEKELLTFPSGRRDDRIDCMSFLQDALDPTYDSQYAKQTRTKFKSYFARNK